MKANEIRRSQTSPGQAIIVLRLDADLFWFQGHFPDYPILPAIAQIDWVMDYASRLLTPDHQFHSIQQVKFQLPLLPGQTVTLTLNWQPQTQLLSFDYQRHAEQYQIASKGKIRLCR